MWIAEMISNSWNSEKTRGILKGEDSIQQATHHYFFLAFLLKEGCE